MIWHDDEDSAKFQSIDRYLIMNKFVLNGKPIQDYRDYLGLID